MTREMKLIPMMRAFVRVMRAFITVMKIKTRTVIKIKTRTVIKIKTRTRINVEVTAVRHEDIVGSTDSELRGVQPFTSNQ